MDLEPLGGTWEESVSLDTAVNRREVLRMASRTVVISAGEEGDIKWLDVLQVGDHERLPPRLLPGRALS